MDKERFEKELRYQTMMSICCSLRQKGVLSEADFMVAEAFLREKYEPIFVAVTA